MPATELTTSSTVACPICGVPAKVAQRVPPAVYYLSLIHI